MQTMAKSSCEAATMPSTAPDRQSMTGSHTQTLAALALSAAVNLNRLAACTSAAAGRWTSISRRSCRARSRRTAPCRWALTPRASPAQQCCSSLRHNSLVVSAQVTVKLWQASARVHCNPSADTYCNFWAAFRTYGSCKAHAWIAQPPFYRGFVSMGRRKRRYLEHRLVPRRHALRADPHVSQRVPVQDVCAGVVDHHVRLREDTVM